MGMLSRRLLKISDASAQERRVWERVASHSTLRDLPSTESSMISWLKVVTSLLETEQVVNQSMVTNSMMRTSLRGTQEEGICQWLMLVQIPTVHNSFCASLRLNGSMANIAFSAKLLKVCKYLMPLNQLAQDKPEHHVSLLIVDNSEDEGHKVKVQV